MGNNATALPPGRNRRAYKFTTLVIAPLISALILTVGTLLAVEYYNSVEALNRETDESLSQRARMAQLVFSSQLETLNQSLLLSAQSQALQNCLRTGDKKAAVERLELILESQAGYLLDLLYLGRGTQGVWLDAELSPDLMAADLNVSISPSRLTSRWNFVTHRTKEGDAHLLLRGVPVVSDKLGNVLGLLYGGVRLNLNLSFWGMIRDKVSIQNLFVLDGARIMASTADSIDKNQPPVSAHFTAGPKMVKADNLIFYGQALELEGQKTGLTLVIAIGDDAYTQLQQAYLKSVIFLLFIAVGLSAAAVGFVGYIGRASLAMLTSYAHEVTKDNLSATYQNGRVQEYNQLGRTLEEMVRRFHERQESLAQAQTIAHLGSWELDMGTRAMCWSDETYRILGLERPGINPDHEAFMALLSPDERPVLEKAMNAALKDEGCFKAEHRVFRPDGSFRWVSGLGYVQKDRDGRPLKMVGTIHDITESKLAREELKKYRDNLEQTVEKRTQELTLANARLEDEVAERKRAQERSRLNESRLQSLIETAAEGIVTINQEGRVLTFNPAAEAIFGYEARELVGQNVTMLMSDPYKSEHDGYLKKYIETEVAHVIGSNREAVGRRKGGGEFPLELSVSEFWEGERRIFTGIVHDITERKKIQEALGKAKREAEALSQAKGRFLANMSHEIRTPMNSVIGYLDLSLEDAALGKRTRRNLSTAARSARTLLRLLNDILDVSKMEAGKLALERAKFNLSFLLDDVMDAFRAKADEKNINLDYSLHPDITQCYLGDQIRLRQVLINLLGNALKFTEKGSVSVQVVPADEPGALHFTVTDTGIGIAADKIENILEPFTQADVATTRRFGGTGLGTTISRQIVELMEGKIWIKSRLNAGTAFHFTTKLPESECAQNCTKDCDHYRENRRASPPRPARRRFKVLLAEDIEENAELCRIRLEEQGHRVTHVWNGKEAVAAHQREAFDLILMDLQMPEMDGLEASSRIRKAEEGDAGRRIPVIALTASLMREDKDRCFEAGMDAVVGKPVDFPDLFDRMEQLAPQGVGRHATGAAKSAMAEPVEILPQASGINMAHGLALWQNLTAYKKALGTFVNAHASAAREIERLLDSGDLPAGYRQAHALKGVSGNLALDRVYTLAKALNTALANEQEAAARKVLVPLARALEQTARDIADLGEPDTEKSELLPEVDQVGAAELMTELLAGLEKDDPGAAEPAIAGLRRFLTADQLKGVNGALEVFDFEAAKEKALRLSQSLGIKLKDEP